MASQREEPREHGPHDCKYRVPQTEKRREETDGQDAPSPDRLAATLSRGGGDPAPAMPKPARLRVSSDSRIIEQMIAAGLASTRSEAMNLAVDHRGRPEGHLNEARLLAGLRRGAAAAPLSDEAISDGVRRAKGARLP